MSNFKIGQKVVFIGKPRTNIRAIYPQTNEIVTILCFSQAIKGNIVMAEYPVGNDGKRQSVNPCYLRPLDNDFADEVEKMIKSQLKEYHE